MIPDLSSLVVLFIQAKYTLESYELPQIIACLTDCLTVWHYFTITRKSKKLKVTGYYKISSAPSAESMLNHLNYLFSKTSVIMN